MTRRMPVLLVLLVTALSAAATGCGGDGDAGSAGTTTAQTAPATTTEAVPTGSTATQTRSRGTELAVTVAGGTVTGGGRREVGLGDEVRIRVTSDIADEVHLHGYDRRVDVEAGGTESLEFVANVPGIFEVELESQGLKLLDLVVR